MAIVDKKVGRAVAKDLRPVAKGRRVTSYDVARHAGVSQSAVSRCFAPNSSIAPMTRDRVVKAAKELGYRPNALAQGLIARRTQLVAILLSELGALYYPEVLNTLTRQLNDCDMRVLLFPIHDESDVDEILDQALRHSVDGVIAAAHLTEAQLQQFADNHVPLVLYNRISKTLPISSVCSDSQGDENDMVTRLLAAGHRSFAVIGGPERSYITEVRRHAVMVSLAEAGIDNIPMIGGDLSYESGSAAARSLFANGKRFDAIICVNDLMAIGAIDTARLEFGLNVPNDVSIVGYDGANAGTWASHHVTSIRQPVQRMTEAAVKMLLERIADPSLPAERRVFSGRFIEGASAVLN